jgi:hypothetical protein
MASVALSPRDLVLLAALDYAPLTARQLQKLSDTWEIPFPSSRLVRERMQRMAEAKLVTSHPYAILRPGQPEHYYLLTRQGYELVHGPDVEPPTRGYFSPIALARHPHQQALSDFIVHTAWGSHQSGVLLNGVYRENTICLTAGGQSLYPDSSFLLTRDNAHFRFFAEIDNGTERVRSQKDNDSIERKIRTYDTFQDTSPSNRFRVLFVSVQNSRDRLLHILETAARVMREPNRTLFYGITLAEYLTSLHPVTSTRFLDHRGRRQSLIPDVKAPSFLSPASLQPARAT